MRFEYEKKTRGAVCGIYETCATRAFCEIRRNHTNRTCGNYTNGGKNETIVVGKKMRGKQGKKNNKNAGAITGEIANVKIAKPANIIIKKIQKS